MKTKHSAQSAPARRSLSTRRSPATAGRRLVGEGGFSNPSILSGLAVFFVGLLLALLATANPQTSMRTRTRNLGAGSAPQPAVPASQLRTSAGGARIPRGLCDSGIIVNGGFETGDFTGWTIDGASNPPLVTNAFQHTGTFSALAGNASGPEPTGDSSFYQQFTVPANGGVLSFYHADFTTDTIMFDWQDAYITDSNGNILQTIFHHCLDVNGWVNQTVDMTPYAGQTVRIKFLVHQDGASNDTGMHVDDVILLIPCVTPTPTPTATPCTPVGSWTEQAPYPIAVSGHAVVSQGGNVYSFGGIVNNNAITNAYKYDPVTNTWTPIASLPAPRGWFSGTTDGTYIYLLGGVDQNFNTTATLWRYDPVSNTYNTNLPSYTIPTYFHATAYLNGKIYRIAGAAIGTDFHVEVYDIATNTWSMAANYPVANHTLMAVALGNYVYGAGGNAFPDKTYRYDPNTNTWDDAAIADLPAGRTAAASGAYNGRWVLAGGDVNFVISTSAIAWDPATNTWSNLANMVQPRDLLAGATAGQSFYAVAGDFGPGNPTNDNQQYTEVPCGTPTPTPTPTVPPFACSFLESFDEVTPPALPLGWTAINGIDPDGILWQTSNSGNPTPPADSPPNAAWVNDPDSISDKYLDSPPDTIDQLENAVLMFRNNYSLEASRDGGVLEISIDGAPFQDILAAGGSFLQGGYNGTISTCCGNPIGGRQAWTGSSGGFITTTVEGPFQGHTIVLRWRMGSDSSASGQGWRIDTVQMICERPTPTATPTATPATPTPTATATTTATPTATAKVTPTPTSTPTPRVTSTPRSRPTPRLRPTPPPRP